VERAPAMLRATRARLRRLKIPAARATVRAADVRHLPFADASFDAVVSTFPTEYIYEPAAAREIARVLRPGGRLIVVLGAALLPARLALWPLVALQTLVYGAARGSTPAGAELPDGAQTSRLGALYAREGVAGRDEHVRGPFWLALLFLGEKSASGAPGGLIH
jgi:SAM-dependent methyltransferase